MAFPGLPPVGGRGKSARDFSEILRRYFIKDRTDFRLQESIQPVVVWADDSQLTKATPVSQGFIWGSNPGDAANSTAFKITFSVDSVIKKVCAYPTLAWVYIDLTNTAPLAGFVATGVAGQIVQIGHQGAPPLGAVLVSGHITPGPFGFPIATNGDFMAGPDERIYMPAGSAIWVWQTGTGLGVCGIIWQEPIGSTSP